MSASVDINGYELGRPFAPYVIAEIGVNHEGSLDLAKRLILEAKEGGAHAAKFQTYKADLLASKHSPAYWDQSKEPTESQHELFQKFDAFGPSEYEALAEYCARVGIDFLSTPFDSQAVEVLAPLVPLIKIASADITNVPLLRQCAATRKPLMISTGAASLPEIEYARNVVREAGCEQLVLLHCILNYPTPIHHAQLGMITTLKRAFPDCLVGYSDHVVPDKDILALQVATLLGAVVLEKHFTHDKALAGNDHYHAMDKHDLQRFLKKLSLIRGLVGEREAKALEIEKIARREARRSIVAARDLKKGSVITESDLIPKRPGHGISPIHWDEVIGREVLRDVPEDIMLSWDMLAPSNADD